MCAASAEPGAEELQLHRRHDHGADGREGVHACVERSSSRLTFEEERRDVYRCALAWLKAQWLSKVNPPQPHKHDTEGSRV